MSARTGAAASLTATGTDRMIPRLLRPTTRFLVLHNECSAAPCALVAAWVTAIGAVVGSFLNVVIARVPRGESVVRPRSRCPMCGSAVAWFDNVPVISWIALRGRCRSCAAGISLRYPAVELLGAAAALAAWWRHGLSPAAALELLFVAVLVALAFIDLDTWLLPHALTWPLIGGGVGANALDLAGAPSLGSSLWGAGIGFAAFAAVSVVGERVFRKPALGFGDVLLLAGIGAFMGAAALLPVVLLASTQGAVVGLLLIGLGRMPRDPELTPPPSDPSRAAEGGTQPPAEKSADGTAACAAPAGGNTAPPRAIPFGPFLALAAVEWLYLSDAIAGAVPALGPFVGPGG